MRFGAAFDRGVTGRPLCCHSKCLVDGAKTTSLGKVRVLTRPPLEPGYNYSYKLQAMWTQNGETMADVRTVQLVPGRAITVDFTRPATEQLPIPLNKQKSSP